METYINEVARMVSDNRFNLNRLECFFEKNDIAISVNCKRPESKQWYLKLNMVQHGVKVMLIYHAANAKELIAEYNKHHKENIK